ncbi:MAG: tandem-95 repeat protein, partial [Deltaproteobacteria bacterium]|nr:tandem-95 repeat protein [Deltaproteobacteria bacterium]
MQAPKHDHQGLVAFRRGADRPRDLSRESQCPAATPAASIAAAYVGCAIDAPRPGESCFLQLDPPDPTTQVSGFKVEATVGKGECRTFTLTLRNDALVPGFDLGSGPVVVAAKSGRQDARRSDRPFPSVACVAGVACTPSTRPPQAVPDAYATTERTVLEVAAPGVLANDSGSSLTATLVSGPSHGALVLDPSGAFVYKPDPSFQGGRDSFVYSIDSGRSLATVTIDVIGINEAPSIDDQEFTTQEDVLLTLAAPGLLSQARDPEGDPLVVRLTSQGNKGYAVVELDGALSYSPFENVSGTDQLGVEVSDGELTGSGFVTIHIVERDDPPAAIDDRYSMFEDQLLTVDAPGVLFNDREPDGEPLRASLAAGPSHGTLSFAEAGNFAYRPFRNFAGTDAFRYLLSDPHSSSEATVTIEVTPIDDPCVAFNDAYSLDEDSTLEVSGPGIVANDLDAEGDVLTPIVVRYPQHGTLTLELSGGFHYTPSLHYAGPDSYDYVAFDGSFFSNRATVSLSMRPLNDVPEGSPDTYFISEGQSLLVPAPGLLRNDADPDGDGLFAILEPGPSAGALQVQLDGGLSFTPAPDQTGRVERYYRASDGLASSDPVLLIIDIAPENDAPVAQADDYFLLAGSTFVASAALGVLSNDRDLELDPLTAQLRAGPARGTLDFRPSGAFTYAPHERSFRGVDRFVYAASDGAASSADTVVTLQVLGEDESPNTPPVANADVFVLDEDTTFSAGPEAGVLANDTDAERQPLFAELVTLPLHGTLFLGADGAIGYTPHTDFSGVDEATYRVNDGALTSNVAHVTLIVNAGDDVPEAFDDAYFAVAGQTLTIPAAVGVLANDRAIDVGEALTAVIETRASVGSESLEADGSFTFQAPATFEGEAVFRYRASDGLSSSNVALVSISVRRGTVTDSPPVPRDDSYTVERDSTLRVSALEGILRNDSLGAGPGPLVATLASGPA